MEDFLPFSGGVKQRAEFAAVVALQEPPQPSVTLSQLVGLMPLGKAYSSSISPEHE